MSDPRIQLPPDAVAALAGGSKIEAIKILREKAGIGLKEAKEQVEAYLLENPGTTDKLNAASAAAGKSFLVKLVFVGLIVALIYFGFERFQTGLP